MKKKRNTREKRNRFVYNIIENAKFIRLKGATMTIDRKELIKVLKRALPGVESGNVILEGADTFIFNDGFIHTYNDSISVSVPFIFTNKAGENVSGALKAKDFFDLINRYAEDNLKFIPKEGVWIIESENANAELTLLKSGILDRVKNIFPGKIKWDALPGRFLEGIALCNFTANKSVLSGIHVCEDIITSTDEIRINWYKMETAIPKEKAFWISVVAAVELGKLDNIKKYSVSDSWVHFKTEDGTIFSCKRLAQDKYPYKKITTMITEHIKEKGDIGNELPAKLMDAVRRASSLSQNIESFNTIKLTLDTDSIEVFSQRTSGKYTEKIAWAKSFPNAVQPISLFVDFAMIENAIKYSKTFYLKTVTIKDKIITRIIFEHENGLQLVSTFEGSE